jgi:hypothetical protein
MQHDRVPIRIFYRHTVTIPVGVVRNDRRDTERFDPGSHREPRTFFKIKHECVLARWRRGTGSSSLVGKFKMESELGTAEHDAVETFVVDERGDTLEGEYVLVKCGYLRKARRRTRDSQVLDLHDVSRSLITRELVRALRVGVRRLREDRRIAAVR